jgi:hypothetical protein
MSLREIVVTLHYAKGVKIVIGYNDQSENWLKECTFEGFIFPEEANEFSNGLLAELQKRVAETFGRWPDDKDMVHFIEQLGDKMTVEVFGPHEDDKPCVNSNIRLLLKGKDGKSIVPRIWDDYVEAVEAIVA